jgi:hypothetical protein
MCNSGPFGLPPLHLVHVSRTLDDLRTVGQPQRLFCRTDARSGRRILSGLGEVHNEKRGAAMQFKSTRFWQCARKIGVALCLGLPAALPAQSPFSAVITVNDAAITGFELEQRIMLLTFFNTPGDEREGNYFSTASPAATQPDLPAERCFTLV